MIFICITHSFTSLGMVARYQSSTEISYGRFGRYDNSFIHNESETMLYNI